MNIPQMIITTVPNNMNLPNVLFINSASSVGPDHLTRIIFVPVLMMPASNAVKAAVPGGT